jgi:hypothetical protein
MKRSGEYKRGRKSGGEVLSGKRKRQRVVVRGGVARCVCIGEGSGGVNKVWSLKCDVIRYDIQEVWM